VNAVVKRYHQFTFMALNDALVVVVEKCIVELFEALQRSMG